jgi:hypothetical protein
MALNGAILKIILNTELRRFKNMCRTTRETPFGIVGRDSSVGIATRYRLDDPGIESRWEARFSAPVQTGPGVHPASYTMDTGSLFRG